jgi:hypothetical protein
MGVVKNLLGTILLIATFSLVTGRRSPHFPATSCRASKSHAPRRPAANLGHREWSSKRRTSQGCARLLPCLLSFI